MKSIRLPAKSELDLRFIYSEETGLLLWKSKTGPDPRSYIVRWNRRYAGKEAGYQNEKGYKYVYVDGRLYFAHRVIWAMMTGVDPGEAEIDHKDRCPANNRWANLRLATRSGNCSNAHVKPGALGIRGVQRMKSGSFSAKISHGNKSRWLGTFPTQDAAERAFRKAAAQLRGEFA